MFLKPYKYMYSTANGFIGVQSFLVVSSFLDYPIAQSKQKKRFIQILF